MGTKKEKKKAANKKKVKQRKYFEVSEKWDVKHRNTNFRLCSSVGYSSSAMFCILNHCCLFFQLISPCLWFIPYLFVPIFETLWPVIKLPVTYEFLSPDGEVFLFLSCELSSSRIGLKCNIAELWTLPH